MRKRAIVLIMAALVMSLSFTACKSKPKSAPGLKWVPDFVNAAFMNASEDVLVGVGMYNMGNDMSRLSMARTVAETRARADISRQMQTIISDMVNDYTAVSELDRSAAIAFSENITQALSRADLRGCRTVAMDTHNGVFYVVMEYSKSMAAQDFNAAQSAAKLAVPRAAAFDALSRMDTAFDKFAGGGPVPVGE